MNYKLTRLDGEHIVLVPTGEIGYNKELIELYKNWLNTDQEVRKGLGDKNTYNYSDIIGLFDRYIREELHFFIYLKTSEGLKPIGDISVVIRGNDLDSFSSYYNYGQGVGYFKIMLGEERSKGYGTEAARLFLAYLIDQLGFEKIFSSYYSDNTASKKMHERLGFRNLFKKNDEGREEIFSELTKKKMRKK
ncbi:MAG: GNAT family N-acetyltransferase [Candidatus Aenigmarchaeota archaeon]|nr:GNAT family N-acetyltransferase [Candidatus Aenigmarchaeota archaeon]